MILFLKHPKSDSWNFNWDRRKEQSKAELRSQRKQAEMLTNIKSECFLEWRSLL